jgi:hypothetical protein
LEHKHVWTGSLHPIRIVLLKNDYKVTATSFSGKMQLDLPQPYLLCLGEETSPRHAKAEVDLRCVETVRAEAIYERVMNSGPEALLGAWQ